MDLVEKEKEKRCRGAFFGCLVGDALGAPAEFKSRDTFPEIREMIPCQNFGGLPAGAFTDDGSMMLCLAASIVNAGGVHDPLNALTHYREWMLDGYLSSTGHCFDVGGTIRHAILAFCGDGCLEADTADECMAGNGSLMRIAPIPIVFGSNTRNAWTEGEKSSRTTHTNNECVWSCGFFSALVGMAIGGATKQAMLDFTRRHYGPMLDNFEGKLRNDIKTTGYVRHTLEATLWAFFGTDTFEDGLILIVNMGGDADTVGAVFGTLAGAHYGEDAIPARWRSALLKPEMTEAIFNDLWEVSKKNWAV
jgi:ADP-ribosyl-[dinitrogen reductase] hydrolase